MLRATGCQGGRTPLLIQEGDGAFAPDTFFPLFRFSSPVFRSLSRLWSIFITCYTKTRRTDWKGNEYGVPKGESRQKMKVYNYSEARQQLTELLDRASREGGVEIRRRDGQAFLVHPAARSGSPLDVPGIDAGLSRHDLTD